jgi:hypothetical protein
MRLKALAIDDERTKARLPSADPMFPNPLTNVFRGALGKRSSLASRQLAQLQ